MKTFHNLDKVLAEIATEQAAMDNDEHFKAAIFLWNERERAKAQSPVIKNIGRLLELTRQLESLKATIKPENQHLIFW